MHYVVIDLSTGHPTYRGSSVPQAAQNLAPGMVYGRGETLSQAESEARRRLAEQLPALN